MLSSRSTMNKKNNCLLKKIKKLNLDGYIIPSNDEFFNEYTPGFLKRLSYLTGFSGSNGYALMMAEGQCVLFTDSRYLLQANQELSSTFNVIELGSIEAKKWWGELKPSVIGYDPLLHTSQNIRAFENLVIGLDVCFKPIGNNLVDELWLHKPEENLMPAFILPLKYAGKSSEAKLHALKASMDIKANYLYFSNPDSICWLLNIRATDIEYNPFLLVTLLMSSTGEIIVFTDPKKLIGLELEAPFKLKILELRQASAYLQQLASNGEILQIDESKSPIMLQQFFDKKQLINITDPVELQKACKNDVELQGFYDCHLQDGIAVTKFINWLFKNRKNIDEIGAAEKLLLFRQEQKLFQYPSFETISAYGQHAAIIHYHPSPRTNQKIGTDNLFLLDSGGQYLNGTTDVTRTMFLGDKPSSKLRKYYTLVLKGHIALANAKFPQGTTGSQLDALARQYLWAYGCDYAHGTGHGVGHFLSVHEGPARISKQASNVALRPGMVLSNEPGFYIEKQMGIRIENLQVVKKSKYENFFEFDVLTSIPLQMNLVNLKMLTKVEKVWLDTYNKKVINTLGPHLSQEENSFLLNILTA